MASLLEFNLAQHMRNTTCRPDSIGIYRMDGQGEVCIDRVSNRTRDKEGKEIYKTVSGIFKFFVKNFNLCGINGHGTVPKLVIGWDEESAESICRATGMASECVLKFHDTFLNEKVVAHEYIHSLLDRVSSLGDVGQAGALHESADDILGVAFKHWKNRDISDWVIDIEIFGGPIFHDERS